MSKSKKRKSTFRKVVEWLHLWPSLVASVILIFVCITGTIVVFSDEVIDFANRDVLYIDQVGEQRIPSEELLEIYAEAHPDRPVPSYMVTYKDPRRTVKFNMFDPVNGLRLVYMNPYTGEILKEDGTIHFFFVTAHLHNSLLLGTVGYWIVDIATIIFVIGLLTGVVLWWPKKWKGKALKKAFTIKWKAKFKRLNYDLHNVLGFYSLAISFVLAVSGLIIAFPPMADGTIELFGGDASHEWEEILSVHENEKALAPMDPVFDRYYEKNPNVTAIQVITYVMHDHGYYPLHAASWVGLKNYIGQPYFIDKYTGAEVDAPDGAIKHEKIENAVWMLHMGSWMGLIGKIATFAAGLIATSLPITGFIYWWGKRK